jgi:hypothetical protein
MANHLDMGLPWLFRQCTPDFPDALGSTRVHMVYCFLQKLFVFLFNTVENGANYPS